MSTTTTIRVAAGARFGSVAWAALSLLACNSGGSTGDGMPPSAPAPIRPDTITSEPDTAPTETASPDLAGVGDSFTYLPIGRDEVSPHGFSAAQAMAVFSFHHKTTLRYADGQETPLEWGLTPNGRALAYPLEPLAGGVAQEAVYAYLASDAGGSLNTVIYSADLRLETEDGELAESMPVIVYCRSLSEAFLNHYLHDLDGLLAPGGPKTAVGLEAGVDVVDTGDGMLLLANLEAVSGGVRAEGRVRQLLYLSTEQWLGRIFSRWDSTPADAWGAQWDGGLGPTARIRDGGVAWSNADASVTDGGGP